MPREKISGRQFSWWGRYIIGAILLTVLPACAQVPRRTSQTEAMPPHRLTSGLITIKPLGTWSGEQVPRRPQVSIEGDQVHIEILSPVVIDIKPSSESLAVKPEPERPREGIQLSRGPIVLAPTP
jgi:hypothetical protein